MAKVSGRTKGGDYAIDVIPGTLTVKLKDYFSMKNLYMLMFYWLMENGYADKDESKFKEDFYYQRENAAGNELRMWWRTQKDVPGTKWYRAEMDVDIHVLAMSSKETVINGKKLKTNEGEIGIEIRCRLLIDPENKFDESTFLKPFKKIFFYRIHNKALNSIKIGLNQEAHQFQEAIKTFLKMPVYGDEIEGEHFWLNRDDPPV